MREAPDRELAAHAGKRARPVVHPIPPVWDVLASCDIAGASDSSIRNAVPNDFTPMLAESHIGRVLCTGRTAYALWRRHCAFSSLVPALRAWMRAMSVLVLTVFLSKRP
ncbi:MAG: hypothetical protein IJL80_14825 [Treponema sp.]|nr:hypothetical protein [Treponema sp.]